MRKNIAAVLRAWLEFTKSHPFISIVVSLIIIAASACGIYLAARQIPTLMQMPCLISPGGGCAG